MTPELIEYLQRSIPALSGAVAPRDQAKILRVISQWTAMVAEEMEQKQLLEDIENA